MWMLASVKIATPTDTTGDSVFLLGHMLHSLSPWVAFLLIWLLGRPTSTQVLFENPIEIRSQNGILTATLLARNGVSFIAGELVSSINWNYTFTPATLVVQPGDMIQLTIMNNIGESVETNVHFHGLHVSPLASADNSFRVISDRENATYEFFIPKSHPSGTFWYHSHIRKVSELQVFSGMSGFLIVEESLSWLPPLLGYANGTQMSEKLLIIRDVQIFEGKLLTDPEIDDDAPATKTINSLYQPTIMTEPQKLQYWRLMNPGPNVYYLLELENVTQVYLVSIDGQLRENLQALQKPLLLPPSSRVDLLVIGPESGFYNFWTRAVDTGPSGSQYPEQLLAVLNSSAQSGSTFMQQSAQQPSDISIGKNLPQDLRKVNIAKKREFWFSQDARGNFLINDRMLDDTRIDTVSYIGDTEEWILWNDSPQWHVSNFLKTA